MTDDPVIESYTFPIVGSFYREVGTKAIIDSLAVNTPIFLRPEPTNHVDPLAIAVWIKISALTDSAWRNLDALLPSFGKTSDELRGQAEWQLGYIPKDLAKLWDFQSDIFGKFTTGGNGGPRITIDLSNALKRQRDAGQSELLRSQLKASVGDID